MISGPQISSFLHYGYLPESVPEEMKQVFSILDRDVAEGGDQIDLVDEGILALRKAFANPGDGTHVVPLSGGFDSRIILGELLEAGLRSQTVAVTFGTPGTFDYEIGLSLAKHMGVRHVTIDLTQVGLNQECLEKTIVDVDAWIWPLDVFYNRLIPDRFEPDVLYWHGFMGETLSGAFLLSDDSESWEAALQRFAVRNRFSRSLCISSPDFHPENSLPQKPFLDRAVLSYYEQLAIVLYQWFWGKNLAAFGNYRCRTPFLHPAWVGFILSVPRRYRKNRYLYREILARAHPTLALLPAESSFGLSVKSPAWLLSLRRVSLSVRRRLRTLVPLVPWGVDPMINYIDFDRGLRERKDLKTLVYENIQDLKKRRIVDWIDIDAIWNRHQRGWANHADALTLLASLEINLKARGIS